jgi:hypothetical protein
MAIDAMMNWDYHQLNGDLDDDEWSPFTRRKSYNIVCKRCGTGGLHWGNTSQGWRLFNSETKHQCQFEYKTAFPKKSIDSNPDLSYNAYLDTIPWE